MRAMLFGFLMLFASMAGAVEGAEQTSAILNDTLDTIKSSTSGWAAQLTTAAMALFGILAAIEIAILGITLVMKGAEMQETIAELVKKIFWFGLILALIQNGTAWFGSIMQSMSQIGSSLALSGTAVAGGALGPSAIIDSGLDAGSKIVSAAGQLPWDAFGASIGLYLAAGIVIVSAFVAAAFIFVALAESIIVMGSVTLIVAFGATRFTSDFVGKTFSYAMSISIKIFFIYAVSGLATVMIDNATSTILAGDDINMLSGLAVAGLAILATILVMQIPSIASSALSGAPSMNVGSMTGNAMAMGTAGAAVGAGMLAASKEGTAILGKSLAQTAATSGMGATSLGIAANGAASLGSKARGAVSNLSNSAGAAVNREATKMGAGGGNVGGASAFNSFSGGGKAGGAGAQSLSSTAGNTAPAPAAGLSAGGQQAAESDKSAQTAQSNAAPADTSATNAATPESSAKASAGMATPIASGVGALAQPKSTVAPAAQPSKGGLLKQSVSGAANLTKNLAGQEWASKAHIPGVNVRLDV
jgi:type IV secretion system protein TrbL